MHSEDEQDQDEPVSFDDLLLSWRHAAEETLRLLVYQLLTDDSIITYEDYDIIYQCCLCRKHIPARYDPPVGNLLMSHQVFS